MNWKDFTYQLLFLVSISLIDVTLILIYPINRFTLRRISFVDRFYRSISLVDQFKLRRCHQSILLIHRWISFVDRIHWSISLTKIPPIDFPHRLINLIHRLTSPTISLIDRFHSSTNFFATISTIDFTPSINFPCDDYIYRTILYIYYNIIYYI